MKNYGYRELFKKETGACIEPDKAVHHLDGDHYNNTIENLICVPSFYHSNYHRALLKAWNPLINKRYTYVGDKDMAIGREIINKAISERDKLLNKGVK